MAWRWAMLSDERLRFWERQLLPTNVTATFEAIAAEATAAYKARVRAQAVRQRGSNYDCLLCGAHWVGKHWEPKHNLVDAQPCAAGVEP